MDRFVIRYSTKKGKEVSIRPETSKKQAKLENLKGVVVIEDLERAKLILEREDSAITLKIDTLKSLGEKLPCREVLLKTRIGKTVHKLCRHSNAEVSHTARQVYNAWKSNILSKVQRPNIEVQCDLKTIWLREKARGLILNSLNVVEVKSTESSECLQKVSESGANEGSELKPEDVCSTNKVKESKSRVIDSENLKQLAEHIEREVFKLCRSRTTSQYKRTNRKIVFVLKYQTEIREQVIKSNLSVLDFVKQYLQS